MTFHGLFPDSCKSERQGAVVTLRVAWRGRWRAAITGMLVAATATLRIVFGA
jgi:hypothetical protein